MGEQIFGGDAHYLLLMGAFVSREVIFVADVVSVMQFLVTKMSSACH